VGFDLHGKTIGLVGTGRIGLLTRKILSMGFGSKVIAFDVYPNHKAAAEYGSIKLLLEIFKIPGYRITILLSKAASLHPHQNRLDKR
jgi:lactate dehydrogenase-like 2-hydroxyacid dehydrogenase